MASSEFALLNAPSDGISRVRFAKSNKRFVVASSWDKSVRLFDVSANEMVAHQTFSAPVLDVVVSDNASSAFCGGLDKQLHSLDFATQKSVVMGQHEGAIRCVEQSNMGSIVTGGWDASCIVWDVRSNRQSGKTDLPGKALSMSVRDWRVLVGCGPSRIAVYDLRRFGPAMEARESPLKHQIRSVGCFPNNQCYAVGSIEGRCAVEPFADAAGGKTDKFAFKCHREKVGDVEMVYPVNCMSFSQPHGTFATGGCDGIVSIWDAATRKRITQYHKYATSISSIDFSADSQMLAIAVSYTFEEGEKPHPPDAIMVRTVKESEVKPKK